MDRRRDQIIEIIKREFIGPDPIDKPGMVQANGEEILFSDPPRIRYAAGILFPQQSEPLQVVEDYEPEAVEIEDTVSTNQNEPITGGAREFVQDSEELMNLSNAYQQSAISMTAAVKDGDNLFVNVSAGVYLTVKEKDEKGNDKARYYRSPINWENNGLPLILPKNKKSKTKLTVTNEWVETNLKFHINYRYRNGNSTVYTFTLENSKVNTTGKIKDEDCYFQVQFSLRSENGFSSLPENEKININDLDYLSNQMLYRNVKSYAVGHGCAASWDDSKDKVSEINTSIFPTYEIKPIVPSKIEGVELEMYRLSDAGDKSEIINELMILCNKYKEWIGTLRTEARDIADQGTAMRHIDNCEECLQRMIDGVELLKNNEQVMLAFQLMNRAMLLQQLHYNMPLQHWKIDKNDRITLENPAEMPDIDRKETWGENASKYGKWRPFQLAFILINLKSMWDEKSLERSIVDLIWFPTGGGKTEAYLGLSAFTIFIRRIKNKNNSGTSILMRYTLRLLTSQQYERASSMICACETIRREREELLGKERISIGLWVGDDTSPNTMTKAVSGYRKLYKGKYSDDNPFLVLKCPWCGAQMGLIGKGHTPGYKIRKINSKNTLILQCENSSNGCVFSQDGYELPLYTVDDDIYEKRPTLLLGTVDKFAMLPFRPKAQSIFGIENGKRLTAPDLIIQDELHLISGPLGSMVGHYETMVHELCSYIKDGKKIVPKVIASTATISRAAEQCHALYGCGINNVKQFPPAGLNAGESFFATEAREAAGRRYVGILAAAASSVATTTIRLYASLLYAAKTINVEKESDRDPYWTNVGYFNSIRELGQTETWIKADIDEYLHVIYKRRYEDKDENYKKNRRYIYIDKELTSRIRSDKIPETLQELSITYPPVDGTHPVDVCLATNMISVGVDVPRLGLMTVSGQPKTTSEYIQATSRVGRSVNAPGLVFTIYNPGKPRDKSHYEHFTTYHSRVYCNVEPTSVTPFAAPLRDRALHALAIGILRLEGDSVLNSDPPFVPSPEDINRIKNIVADRISLVDPEELDQTLNHLDAIFHSWEIWNPQRYQDFTGEDALPLMFPAGSMRNELWGEHRGFPTPTSMRNVDASCEARVLENGYYLEDE